MHPSDKSCTDGSWSCLSDDLSTYRSSAVDDLVHQVPLSCCAGSVQYRSNPWNMEHVLDHANRTGAARQHELDTDH